MKWFVAVLFTIVAIAALVGVYQTHIIVTEDPTRVLFQFGSTSGSLSIIAFVLAIMAWIKHLKAMAGKCEICGVK